MTVKHVAGSNILTYKSSDVVAECNGLLQLQHNDDLSGQANPCPRLPVSLLPCASDHVAISGTPMHGVATVVQPTGDTVSLFPVSPYNEKCVLSI